MELVFWIRNRELLENLKAMDVEPDEDGNLILSRRIMEGRGVSRIGGSPVPVAKVREVTKLLLDIHGQHEHQSLLYPSKHLEILDEFAKKDAAPVKKEISRVYSRYQECLKELEGFSLPEEERLRQLDFLRFEIDEIENARLSEGEEEELTSRFRRMQHAQKIAE
ncbi:MAG: DNA repair protein RecN, partial [Selenomonadaceae bacterium]|nr:DNA repair protein RecN [Selenomonadaceae bacterium]